MKILLAALGIAAFAVQPALATDVELGGVTYDAQVMSKREIGPGILHTRYRINSYPLNINVLTVDLNNPYNRIETTVANESAKGTESLVSAAKRQSSPGHRALAAANANFWVVPSQPEEKTYTGTTRNASVRNGVIVTESNQHRDQWDGGTMRTGVVAMSYDKTAYIDYCTSSIQVTADKIGSLEVHQCNKGVHNDELCMYNSYYGSKREFMPIKVVGGKYDFDEAGDATEVILDLEPGQTWDSGRDIKLTVAEVRTNAGKGTLGDHDLALVGRGANRDKIAALAVGDKVTLKYTWTYNPGSANEVTPLVEQAVGGNALVMRNGELTPHNSNETYNSQVYSRTGYGTSADGKTLYIVVIDKSTDPVYGASKGCNTAVMCEFARSLGCSNMANFDAGGSAEMMVNGKIENKTTEGSPRAVANGWMIYSIAPEDTPEASKVARLVFDELEMKAPIYGSFTPKVIAYNTYGAVIDYNFTDFTLSCDPSLGSCEGSVFTAGAKPASGKITASYGDVTVEGDIEVLQAQIALRVKPILIDGYRQYPMEVEAVIASNTYSYNPATIQWTVDDTTVAEIDGNGVLHGKKEGTTTIHGTIGDFNDQTEVTVEIAPAPEIAIGQWDTWTVKGSSGITLTKLDAEGKLTFTYGSARDPYVSVSNKTQFYSIPDGIFIEFTPSVEIRQLSFDMRAPFHAKTNVLTIKPADDGVFEAGKTHKLELPISMLGDPADISLYPISLNYLRFYMTASSNYKGSQEIRLGNLSAVYSHTGIEDLVAPANADIAIVPNPVEANGSFAVIAHDIVRADIFSLNGTLVKSVDGAKAEAMQIAAPSTPGTYLLRVLSDSGTTASILIVK